MQQGTLNHDVVKLMRLQDTTADVRFDVHFRRLTPPARRAQTGGTSKAPAAAKA